MRAWTASCILAVLLLCRGVAAAADHAGQVTFNGLPVPGATVTALRDDARSITTTDQNGVYRFEGLADGMWTLQVDMFGFASITREISLAATFSTETWALALLPIDAIDAQRENQVAHDGASAQSPAGSAAATMRSPSSSDRTGVSRAVAPVVVPSSDRAADESAAPAGADNPVDPFGAATGFLINGSVNNGAASLFAQAPAFGNNRPGAGSQFNGGVGVILGNSAWDARPFSFANRQTPKPSYQDVQIVSTFGGPIRLPRIRTRPVVYFAYQRASDHAATTQSTLMPTVLERSGNFSRSFDAYGQPVTPVDPLTGAPFKGNVIPADRLSPQAQSLLNYYPLPNVAGEQANYQQPSLVATQQDSGQFRITQTLPGRNQLFGNLAYQRTTTDTTNVFRFEDQTRGSTLDASANWSHRFSQTLSLRLRFQMTRTTANVKPFFANRVNVSGDAGINGTDQSPANWGPPTLRLSSGFAALSTANEAVNVSTTHGMSAETIQSAGRHTVTTGGGFARTPIHLHSQLDPRGTFVFDGSITGSDLADFLLGIPTATSIGFGNTDTFLQSSAYNLYINDDLRVSPALTINAGLRWEHEAPATETEGQLSNLTGAPDFSRPVVTTGTSVLQPDRRGLQPRLGFAWRPVAGSSLVVRGGYGIYRNVGVYQSITTLLAQQPPFSTTAGTENSRELGLTLENGFAHAASSLSTFAVDPAFRVGSAHTWQLSAQRDLPWSLTVLGTYLGSKGTHLMQERLPNTYPRGVVNPCAECQAGFVYLTSDGRSLRNSLQMQVRRRLRNGLAATVQYTLAKATDDAAAFSGASMSGAAVAQDWLDLEAERSASAFDQRHLLDAQVQYTTGASVVGGALVDSIRGALLKDWTFVVQLTAGSGLPFTPLYLNSTAGTAIVGAQRADLTGASITDAPEGYAFNPSAFRVPAEGEWGTAGRNSIVAPRQFTMNAAIARTFRFGGRLNLDWRVDASNVLNHTTYSSVNTIVTSPQFGLPDRANQMRKIQTSLRMRF